MRDPLGTTSYGNRQNNELQEVTMSDSNERFAASDVEYNVITTLSNLLQAEDVLRRYS